MSDSAELLLNVQIIVREFFERNQIDASVLAYNEVFDDFQAKVDMWLDQLEEERHKDTFLRLLAEFDYIHMQKAKISFINAHKKFVAMEPTHPHSVYIPVGSNGGIHNGAIILMESFRLSNRITKVRCADQPREFYEEFDMSSITNIVLVDDILGSGTTVKYFIERLMVTCPDIFVGRNIYVLTIVALQKGVDTLADFASKVNLNIVPVYDKISFRAFDAGNVFLTQAEADLAKTLVKRYEIEVCEKKIDVLGYKKSQSLVAFFHNTPNNTLPVFWEDGAAKQRPWNTLFPREKSGEKLPTRSTTLKELKEDVQKTKDVNYNLKKLVGLAKEQSKNLDEHIEV